MKRLLFWLYRLVVMPTAGVLLPFAALLQSKIRAGMRLRRGRYEGFPEGIDPIWIHAASGEFEYAKAVIRELKNRAPDVPILVTFFSPTFAKAVMSFEGVDRALPLPLDLPGPCASFLRKMHPRVLLVARTDLWPEMLERCRERRVPVVLFSYTQKPFSSQLKRFITSWRFDWVDRIYCVAPTDEARLGELQLKAKLATLGDSRYDQVHYRLSHPKPLPEALRPKVACLVAGSTWPEDEAVLFEALGPLLKSGKLKLILVPHEPTPSHLAEISKRLQTAELTHRLFSEKRNWDDSPVLVVDAVGVLAELYRFGAFAFVGGSFRKSVHSVMEALGTGAMTFVGPLHTNNREAVEFSALKFANYPGLQVAEDAADFRAKLTQALEHPESLSPFAEALTREFDSRLGASAKLVRAIQDLI